MELLFFLGGSALFVLISRMAYVGRRDLIERGALATPQFTAGFLSYGVLAGLVIAAASCAAWTLPLSREAGFAAGGASLLLGLGLHIAARSRFSFRNAWGLDTSRLVTSGVYRYLRHPQNVGLGLVFAGIALLGRSGVGLLFVALYAVTCRIWLPIEEAAMERRFGASYAAYRLRTPAFNPFAVAFRPRSQARNSIRADRRMRPGSDWGRWVLGRPEAGGAEDRT